MYKRTGCPIIHRDRRISKLAARKLALVRLDFVHIKLTFRQFACVDYSILEIDKAGVASVIDNDVSWSEVVVTYPDSAVELQ